MYVIFSVVVFLIVIAALVDIITRDDWQVRHLPKLTWVLLVIFLPLIGSLIWFLVGREWSGRTDPVPFGDPRRHEGAVERSAAAANTEAQLAALDAEIAAAERDERIRRLEVELEARKRGENDRA